MVTKSSRSTGVRPVALRRPCTRPSIGRIERSRPRIVMHRLYWVNRGGVKEKPWTLAASALVMALNLTDISMVVVEAWRSRQSGIYSGLRQRLLLCLDGGKRTVDRAVVSVKVAGR